MPRKKADENIVTPRQQQVLDYVAAHIQEKGYPPSVRDICAAVGFKSTSSAHAYLEALEKKGLLHKDASKTRALKVTSSTTPTASSAAKGNVTPFPDVATREVVNVPIVGKVTAGQPILAVESIEDTFPVPLEFVGNQDAFMLKVRGESMIEAGILDGDFVLVSKQSTARNGDIVVALIEDEATVKTFYRENGYVRLQPENPYMEPIIVRENLSILGKVSGVFRKM